MGTPCGSWSRARDRPNGPPALRSDDDILGYRRSLTASPTDRGKNPRWQRVDESVGHYRLRPPPRGGAWFA
eukprot:3175476-Pyramimonas_sp.AAC.1